MIWVPVILLAAAAFGFAALVLRLPRGAYTLVGAALVFGLAGYALQGSPGQPGAPANAARDIDRARANGELFVEARREFFDPDVLPSRFLITSDAFARRSDFARAAAFANSALADNPADAEAWTALGIALIEHAGGRMTPAAMQALRRAEQSQPGLAAPGYFLGLALLRAGEPRRAREIWADVLAASPADARWRPVLAERLARLDMLIASAPAP